MNELSKDFREWCRAHEITEGEFLRRVEEGVLVQYDEPSEYERKEDNLRFVVLPLYSPTANLLRDRLHQYGWDKQMISEAIRDLID